MKEKDKPITVGVGSEDDDFSDIVELLQGLIPEDDFDDDGTLNVGKIYEKILNDSHFTVDDEDRKMLEKKVRKYKLKNLDK